MHDLTKSQFKSRCNQALFLGHLTKLLLPFLFAIGTLILLLRYFIPALFIPSLVLLGLTLLLVSVARRRARAECFSDDEARVWLDRKSGGRGLFLLESMVTPAWMKSLTLSTVSETIAAPTTRWSHWAKQWAPALLFVLLVCLLPIEPFLYDVDGQSELGISNTLLDELQEDFELLEENNLLDEDEQEAMEEEIRKLAEEAQTNSLTPSFWEGLDHLKEEMQAKADERTGKVGEAMSGLDAMTSMLGKDMDIAQALDAKQQLERSLAGLEGMKLPDNLSEEAQDALNSLLNGDFDFQGELREGNGNLADALAALRAELGELHEGLHEDGL